MNARILVAVVLVCLLTACVGLDDTASTVPTPMPVPTNTIPPHPLEVAYIRDDNVWIWTENVGSLQLSNQQNVSAVRISQDGNWIAYLQRGELWLTRFNVTPSSSPSEYPKLLISNDYLFSLTIPSSGDARIVRFAFSPDNENIYFTAFIGGDNGGLDLFRVNVDNPMPVRFVGPGLGGDFHISPDGLCLTISRPNQLDLFCNGDQQPRRIFELANECGFGAHAGPDIEWKGDSSGFYVVVPDCDDNILHGHMRLFSVPRANEAPALLVEFIGWTYDLIDIAPNGSLLAHFVDYGDLRDLHLVNVNGDDIYVSFPKDEFQFLGWLPNSKNFIIQMPENNKDTAISKLYYANRNTYPVPLLTEYQSTPGQFVPAANMKWVSDKRFIFTGNGLWIETLNENRKPIDTDNVNILPDYDFSPKP